MDLCNVSVVMLSNQKYMDPLFLHFYQNTQYLLINYDNKFLVLNIMLMHQVINRMFLSIMWK